MTYIELRTESEYEKYFPDNTKKSMCTEAQEVDSLLCCTQFFKIPFKIKATIHLHLHHHHTSIQKTERAITESITYFYEHKMPRSFNKSQD